MPDTIEQSQLMMEATLAGLAAIAPYAQQDGSIQSSDLAAAFQDGLARALKVLHPTYLPLSSQGMMVEKEAQSF